MTEQTRKELLILIADKLLDCADTKELERFYWDAQYEYADALSSADLKDLAKELNIDIPENT